MGRRYVATGTPIPKALALGLLEDNGRVLFLLKNETAGSRMVEQIGLPSVVVPSGRSPVAEIKDAFLKQTGIDGEVHEIVLEGRFNAGSRKRRAWVPALAFRITAKNRNAKPSDEFSGFRWLSLDEAKKKKLARSCEWLAKIK